MRSLGDKISSTIVAQHAKVPCMDWSGTGIDEVTTTADGLVTVTDEVYQKACVHDADEGLERAAKIGYPVMIKASEGGGGKGIRMVSKDADFKQSFQAVLTEVPGASLAPPSCSRATSRGHPLTLSAFLQARPCSS